MSESKKRKKENRLIDYLNNERFSDLIISCRDKSWKVHKVMLCAASVWFENACNGAFKEASADKISLDYDDPDTLTAMLSFIYDGTYTYPSTWPKGPISAMDFDALVYALADKYDIPRLKSHVRKKFRKTVSRHSIWHNELKPVTMTKKDQSVQVAMNLVKTVYASTPASDRELRDIVIRGFGLRQNSHDCWRSWSEQKILIELAREAPDFGSDLAVEFIKRWGLVAPMGERTFVCSQCVRRWKAEYDIERGDNNLFEAGYCPYCGHAYSAPELKCSKCDESDAGESDGGYNSSDSEDDGSGNNEKSMS